MGNKHKKQMSKKQQNQQANKQRQVGTTTVRQLRQIPATMSCVFEHQATETTADFEWRGVELVEVGALAIRSGLYGDLS